jgi:F0F1-type ATP synthase membrane subunit b/b'
MEQSTLQEILSVEKQLREQLDAERQQASQWLENARREIETEHLAELERIRQEAARTEEAVRQSAKEGAAKALAETAQVAGAVDRWSEADLKDKVRACLVVLVPETVRAR